MVNTFSLAKVPSFLYFILASMLSHGRRFPIAPHSATLQPALMALDDIMMPYEAFLS